MKRPTGAEHVEDARVFLAAVLAHEFGHVHRSSVVLFERTEDRIPCSSWDCPFCFTAKTVAESTMIGPSTWKWRMHEGKVSGHLPS